MATINKLFVLNKNLLATLLFVFALFGSQFNYLLLSLLFPGDDERYASVGISPEVFLGLIFISGTMMLYLNEQNNYKQSNYRFSTPFISLIFFSIVTFFSIVYNEVSFRPLITLLSFIFYFFSGRILIKRYGDGISQHLNRFLLFIPPLFMILLVYFFISDRIYYLPNMEFLKPQIEGGIRSTEIAIFGGLQLIYLLYCYTISQKISIKVLISIFIILEIFLLLFLFSFATISGLLIIISLWFLLMYKHKFKVAIISLLVIGVIFVTSIVFFMDQLMFLYEFVMNTIESKTYDMTQGPRSMTRQFLVSTIEENPIWGIGWGNFSKTHVTIWWGNRDLYPHQNFLGIATENGVISAVFYISFVFSIITLGFKLLLKKGIAMNRHFLFMAFACFSFLQFKGMIQDTWHLKEIYLWAGVIVGIKDRLYIKNNVRENREL